MKRHIKFPLFMKDDFPARTLEEFREHFDFQKMMSYYADGKLAIWLRDRYYDDLSETVRNLNSNATDITKKLCELLEVEYHTDYDMDLSEFLRKNERLGKIKMYTNKSEVLDDPDCVAFSQEEFEELLRNDKYNNVYIFSGDFTLPLLARKVSVYGLDNPSLEITVETAVKCAEVGAEVHEIRCNKKLLKAAAVTRSTELLNKLGCFAFNQQEFDELLGEKKQNIYLSGKDFSLKHTDYPVNISGLSGNDELKLTDGSISSYTQKGVTFNNISLLHTIFEPGEVVTFGKDSLEWIVLSVEDEKTLLISKDIVKSMAMIAGFGKHFDRSYHLSDSEKWAKTDVRKWLNEDFYRNTFSELDRIKIISKDNEFISLLTEIEYHKYSKIIAKYDMNNTIWLRDFYSSSKYDYCSTLKNGLICRGASGMGCGNDISYINGLRPVILVEKLCSATKIKTPTAYVNLRNYLN